MSKIQYFFWLIKQSWSGIIYDWKVSLTLTIIAVVVTVLNNPFKPKSFTPRNLLLLTPFLITVVLFLFGTLFVHNNYQAEAPKWPAYLLLGFALLHIPLAIYLFWKMKSFRWSTIAINLFQMNLSRWALFVAGMSVTGDWL